MLFGITIYYQSIGLELLSEDCKLHIVMDNYWTVEGMLKYFGITLASR